MKLCRKGSVVITVLLCLNIQAQTDFPLSVLTSSHAQLNPATTGLFDAEYRFQAYFKSQMIQSVAGGVKGAGASMDYSSEKLKMGWGIMLFSNSVDRSALKDFNVLLSYGYRIELNDRSLISLGLQTGFKQVSFSLESLTFGSQYDPSYKGGYDPSRLPSFSTQANKNSFDVSVGAQWYAYLGTFFAIKMGASAFHLVPIKTEFFSDETYLRPKYVINLNGRYEQEKIHWMPAAMFVHQDDKTYAEIGLSVQRRQKKQFFGGGVYYRSPNVIIPTVGLGWDKFAINISLEYFFKNNYSKMFNINLAYYPQTNRRASLIQDFQDI